MEKDSYYYYSLGEDYFSNQKFEDAIKNFLMSLKIEKHYKTYERLYECCNNINQKALAGYFIQLAYEENNNNDKVSLLYSRLLIEENKLNEATKILQDILKRNPSYKQARIEYDKMLSLEKENSNE